MDLPVFHKKTSHIPSLGLMGKRYLEIRKFTEKICRSLEPDDFGVQSMPDVSPVKWHLAHTTWFFETFILKEFYSKYVVFHPQFHFLFNSYYETLGDHQPRPERHLINRPTTKEIFQYRSHVDQKVLDLLNRFFPSEHRSEILKRLELGLQHEQQHQELLLMDIKHVFYMNPMKPSYPCQKSKKDQEASKCKWIEYSGGMAVLGFGGKSFAYDNEKPKHQVFLNPYALCSRLATNGEFLEFIENGGYHNSQFWLADGWNQIQTEKWQAPLYWEKLENQWMLTKLSGVEKLPLEEPVCHVSFYEANAFARYKGVRLPTESEWENAATELTLEGNFLEKGILHPETSIFSSDHPEQMFGDCWECTQSTYSPYPGFKPEDGSLGEYNGKFMCNQMVFRGGSCVTSHSHMRVSYRNFFYPHMRWQFSGIRLAKDLE